MLPSRVGLTAGLNFTVRLSSSSDNYDLRAALGSPAGPANVTVIIDSGVTIGSSSPLSPAFTTGSGWATGSRLRIINSGKIHGHGGNGGKGGFVQDAPLVIVAAVAGTQGGDALNLTLPTTIDNTSGEIFGGGGGGGGGQGFLDGDGFGVSGSGGGGGQGSGTTSGGAAGNGFTGVTAGNAGTGGSTSSAGSGGASATNVQSDVGGAGGNGGGWGAAGSTGGGGLIGGIVDADAVDNGAEAAGGVGGYAVRLNGQSITWVAGNNGTQVKGAVA